MPKVSSDPDFEEIPNDVTRLLCRVCTDTSDTSDCIIKKSSKRNHKNSERHKSALRERTKNQATGPASATVTQIQVPSYANLPPAHIFGQILPQAEVKNVPEYSNDPLQDLFVDDESGTYVDRFGNSISFSAGENHALKEIEADKTLLRKIDNLAYLGTHNLFGHFDEDSVSEPDDTLESQSDTITSQIASALTALEPENDDVEEDETIYVNAESNSEWFPHVSKTMFMLDLLDNLPRLRLSDEHLKAIIWVMRECGTPNVPTFSALRKAQSDLMEKFQLQSIHHVSPMGNHFFMNHPAKLIALDWSNPLVRKHMHLYPEVAPAVSETWQAEKWLNELQLDELSPMWADWKSLSKRHRHFYIHELAQTLVGDFVVLQRWVMVNGEVHVDVFQATAVETQDHGLFITIQSSEARIPAKSLAYNFLDIHKHYKGRLGFSEYSPDRFRSMNPLRSLSDGRPMFRLRMIPWSDDVSGNVSKQYNPHTNVYLANAHLPHRLLSQEYFIRYCSTSQSASSSEQFVALCEDLYVVSLIDF
ncbi:hypothetical protein K435DRAFT_875476 [Dendrothele bispora CBS 962.96]|uniref:Uncharacterized protein n=1 Tax=Dendrothele bispora (strain CBS 962.96) TaxID=1314807 RepID=A0A4S8KUL2_DENBC|nr:hypothetical protein K435DRAFT_875476 [Dendrothele bispora CBS 962.96]